jgi:hypothetical protein
MQRVFRLSFAMVGVLGIASLAACGDKITNNETGASGDSVVHSVTVTPQSASMNVGDKVTFAASVDAGARITNRTVTWSSSNAAVATVDAATGAATAVAAGTASIIAKSVADPTVQGAAVVSVAAGVPATVTIGQVNTTVCGTNGVCSSIPATLNNVANQLDVTLNVDAGTQKLAGVDLIMNCGGADTVVASQNLGSADAAPLGAEDATAPVTLSFNTAAFNAATGAPNFKNGVCTLKARARLQNGQQVASSTQTITLNNVDFISTTMTTTPSTGQVATATDNKGLLWHAGAVNVTVVPVSFTTGGTIASATVSLYNGGGDNALGQNAAVVGPGGLVATLSGLTPTGGVITASFPNSTSATGGVGGATVDTLVAVVTTVTSGGNAGPSLTLPIPANVTNFIRLDNLAPDKTIPTFTANTQNTNAGWVGSAFLFSKAIALASDTLDNGGVDKVTITTQASPAGAGTFTTFASPSNLAETSSSTAYDLRVIVCDALGNCSTTGVLGQFGIDLTPPSLARLSGPKNLGVYNIGNPPPTTASFSLSDTSNTTGVSASGSGTNGLLVSDQGLKPDSSNATGSRTVCAIGTATGSGNAKTCKAPVAEPLTFSLPTAAITDGEYTMVVTATDQAGNSSAALTIKYYVDQDAPTLTAAGQTFPNPINSTTSFTLAAKDSMDIAAGNGFLAYGGVHFFETGTASPTGALFDNALVRTSNISVTLSTFYKSLQAAVGGNVPGTAGVLPSTVGMRAIDAAGNLSTNTPVDLTGVAANIGTATAISNNSTTNGITTFKIDSIVKNPADAATAVQIFVDETAFSSTSGNPFTQVCFYYASPSGAEGGAAGPSGAAAGELIKIGCATNAATTGVTPPTRFFQYTFTWTPPSIFYGSSVTIYAVGNTASNDALISDPVVLNVNALP